MSLKTYQKEVEHLNSPIAFLQIPKQPLFVGSYIKVPVIIKSRSYKMEDLDFTIQYSFIG